MGFVENDKKIFKNCGHDAVEFSMSLRRVQDWLDTWKNI